MAIEKLPPIYGVMCSVFVGDFSYYVYWSPHILCIFPLVSYFIFIENASDCFAFESMHMLCVGCFEILLVTGKHSFTPPSLTKCFFSSSRIAYTAVIKFKLYNESFLSER